MEIGELTSGGSSNEDDKNDDKKGSRKRGPPGGESGRPPKRKMVLGVAHLIPNEWVTLIVRCHNFDLNIIGHTHVILRDGHTSRVRIDVVAHLSGDHGGFLPTERIQYFKASTTIKFNESVVDTNTLVSNIEGSTVRLMALKRVLPQEIHETEWLPNLPPDPLGDHTEFNV
jgi:hypothetical protein